MTTLQSQPTTSPSRVDDSALDQIFREARTHSAWSDQPVSASALREVYELARMGPTGANAQPLRVVYITSLEAKERLLPTLMAGNVEKTRTAPVTAILAYDSEFYNELPRLFPHMDVRPMFANDPEMSEKTAVVNSSLQSAYFVLAARSIGLDCGPMAGFDNAAVDAEFFAGTTWRSLLLCNLGYGSGENLFPRSPRLEFEEAVRVL